MDRYPTPEHLRGPRERMLWNAACVVLIRNSTVAPPPCQEVSTLSLASLSSRRLVKTAQENGRIWAMKSNDRTEL